MRFRRDHVSMLVPGEPSGVSRRVQAFNPAAYAARLAEGFVDRERTVTLRERRCPADFKPMQVPPLSATPTRRLASSAQSLEATRPRVRLARAAGSRRPP